MYYISFASEAVFATTRNGWAAFEGAQDRIDAYDTSGIINADDTDFFKPLVEGQIIEGEIPTSAMSDGEVFTTINGGTITYSSGNVFNEAGTHVLYIIRV